MIEFDSALYPLTNVKYIAIDRKKLTLTIYFMEGLKLYPKTIEYESEKDLNKKVEELNGTKRKSLLG